MTFLEQYSFADRRGQQLWRVLAGFFPVMMDAANFAEKFGIDPLDLPMGPGMTARQLWHIIIEKAASKGTLRDLVKDALAQNPRSPAAPFLKGLRRDARHRQPRARRRLRSDGHERRRAALPRSVSVVAA